MRRTGEERRTRDTLVLRLHLAGVTYREIGARTQLSVAGVHKVVKRELRESADRRGSLCDEAVEQYLARLETLLAANWSRALKGDARAAEQCRRMLDSMARVQGLFPSLAERLLPDTPPRDDADPIDDEDDDDDCVVDELARYRRA